MTAEQIGACVCVLLSTAVIGMLILVADQVVREVEARNTGAAVVMCLMAACCIAVLFGLGLAVAALSGMD